MAHAGSKGYYVKKLKELGIRRIDYKPLESFKTFYLANLYYKYINSQEQ
jgi:hypothetical protein